ncbi:hypothetical protein [Thermococcus stetteri]|uniref:hypothetical protein n=1 Tax=Thermococcus stetteri TaxID=49900 RepID=UPI001AEB2C3A|nr:hypothetical protein [Thermococcus stetteri]MBP1911382.1 tetratricopeptide (TPR) repeat protein [Thermococcus stetteri]
MITLEDVITLAERGQFDEAIERASQIDDEGERIEALTKITLIMNEKGLSDWAIEVIADAEYIAQHSKDPYVKAVGYARIGSVLFKLGYPNEAMEFLDVALDVVGKIPDPLLRGNAVAMIAYYYALTGDSETAIWLFDTAFDLVSQSERDYRTKVDELIRIGELIEAAGDNLPSQLALQLYHLAFDIFDKLYVNQKAATVEKKIRLATITQTVGLPEVRKALLEGRYRYALALIRNLFSGVQRLIGELEVALWMKVVENPEYVEITDNAIRELLKIEISPTDAYRIALLLTELRYLESALRFAENIEDVRKKDTILRGVALALAEYGDYERAREIAGRIFNPAVREQTLREIEAMELG